MAVVKMKKAYLIAHQSLKPALVSALQNQGLLHITNLREKIFQTELGGAIENFKPEANDLELLLSKIQFVVDFISGFETKKKGILASLIKEKVKIDRAKFEEVTSQIDFDDIYEKCEYLDVKLMRLAERLTHLHLLRESLVPWIPLKLELKDVGETKQTVFALGKVPSSNLSELQVELEETVPESFFEVVSQDAQNANLLFIYLKEQAGKVQSILHKYNFSLVSFPGLKKTPQEEILNIEAESKQIVEERASITNQVQQLVLLKPNLLAFYDFVENKKIKAEIETNFAHTEQAFMLEGWAPAEKQAEFTKAVTGFSSEVDLTLLDPAKDEKPPTVLKNRYVFQPFEVLTRLYGLPDYNELDPTPLLAPFFFLFFGICIGDFGYGLVLILLSRWLSRKLEISENARRFLRLFAYGGVASMIVGVLTGGYFGIDLKDLPLFLRQLMLFDPLAKADLFLVIAWMLGIIHLSAGIIAEIWDNIRNGQVAEAIFGPLATLLFLLVAITWVTGWVAQVVSKTPPPLINQAYSIAPPFLIAMVFFVIFAQGGWLQHYVLLIGDAYRTFRAKEYKSFFGKSYAVIYGLLFVLALIGWAISLIGFSGTSLRIVGLMFAVGLLAKVSRPLLVKFFAGLYSLYGMTSFIGDILSYSRLMAIGLATVLIGFVVNMLAKTTFYPPYPLTLGNVLLAIVSLVFVLFILAIGHIFNLVINLLGAFVHPLRLQYVEFFPKFYQNGGHKFQPFAFETRHLTFVEKT